MSLPELRYWRAHGGERDLRHWWEAWRIEAHYERQRQEAQQHKLSRSNGSRHGLQRMRLR